MCIRDRPLIVTRAQGHRILTLNGKPAWPEYLARLGLPAQATIAQSSPIGALAERLPPEMAAEYGNEHILRAVTLHDPDDAMHFPTTCVEAVSYTHLDVYKRQGSPKPSCLATRPC